MKHRFFIFSLFVVYILSMTVLMTFLDIGISVDRYAFVILLGSLLVKKTRDFISDWIPFLFVLISYDFLRGFTTYLLPQAHFLEMINLDKRIFGFLPTIFLQNQLYVPGSLSWYDYLGTVMYLFHFLLPVCFGFLLWITNKNYFKEFVTGFALLSYAAFITYVTFPSAAPWVASQKEYIPEVTKVIDQVLGGFNLAQAFRSLNPAPISVIPSVHTAYPLLIFLFSYRFFKLKALYFLPYVLFIWFFIVYSGEHYVTDVISGIIYAIFFFLLSTKFLHQINWHPIFQKIPLLRGLNIK